MKTKKTPIIGVELKRNLWFIWIALFMEFFLGCGSILSTFRHAADVTAMGAGIWSGYSLSSTRLFGIMLLPRALWVSLLVFMQFHKDNLNFKQALPFTNKSLLISKFFTCAVIAVFACLFYMCAMLFIMRRYDWLIRAINWIGDTNSDSISVQNLIFCTFVSFVFIMALYWYGVLCNALCKNAPIALGLALLSYEALISAMNLAGELGMIQQPFNTVNSFLTSLFGSGADAYTGIVVLMLLSLITVAVSLPLSLILYGGGTSKHPLFRYDFVQIYAALILIVFFACIAPGMLNAEHRDVPLGVALGVVAGICTALTANFILKRGVEK